ncbi:MAG: FAD-dependent oxidoreductase [Halanaerobium sp.]
MQKVIIVGASDVGISAALRIRELDQNVRPLVIADNNFPNYSICGIPFYIGGEVKKVTDLAHRKQSDIEAAGIDLKLNTEVTAIKPEQKIIEAVSENGEELKLEYDKLVLGTGGRHIKPDIEGINLPGVFFMRWMDECLEFDNYLKEEKPEEALIVGGGYVGLEMAEALIRRGQKVTLVEFLDNVLNTVDLSLRKEVEIMMQKKGVDIITATAVEKIENQTGSLLVKGSNGFEKEVDTVLVSVGTRPNTELGKEAGINTGFKKAFEVNRKMETNLKDIYAGGDCAETLNYITGKYNYYALGTVAHKHGRIIGSNICGLETEFEGVIGTQSLKLFDHVIARTGLNEKEAAANSFEPISVEIEADDHKHYYPESVKLKIKVTADTETERILGAQIMGEKKAEISKRIDIFAAAIYNQLTVNEFSQLDLSYTPPLSSPWDPVQTAVQQLEAELRLK